MTARCGQRVPDTSACALAGSGLLQIFGQSLSLSIGTSWAWKGPREDAWALALTSDATRGTGYTAAHELSVVGGAPQAAKPFPHSRRARRRVHVCGAVHACKDSTIINTAQKITTQYCKKELTTAPQLRWHQLRRFVGPLGPLGGAEGPLLGAGEERAATAA